MGDPEACVFPYRCWCLFAVVAGGSNALRKFVTDGVNNATQDANYKGVSVPFYTVGSQQGQRLGSLPLLVAGRLPYVICLLAGR